MKNTIYRLCVVAAVLMAVLTGVRAENGYIDTLHYRLCGGDTMHLTLSDAREVKVYRDTMFTDTVSVSDPEADSIHLYIANAYATYRQVERREFIPGQSFTWRGETIQSAGTYTKTYRTVHDCDSVHILVVTEKAGIDIVLHHEQVIPFCDSVSWNGTMYYESARVVDSLKSLVYGCDSIVTTYLQKGIPFHHYATDTLLAGQTMLWHGLTITEGGVYTDAHTNRLGCDSTYVLRVITKEGAPSPKTTVTRESICEGDAFVWRNLPRTLGGIYYDTVFVNGTDIDSLFVLHLTVNKPYEKTETVSFSTFPQLYRGLNITAPGTYEVVYTASTGCDSTIHIIVNRETIIHEESVTICPGDSYTWRFRRLTEEQTYRDVVKGRDGKDSVQYILHLHVRTIPVTRITRTICKGDSYVFGTRILTEAGVYRHTYQQDGCDSTVELSLNIADVDTIVQVKRLEKGTTYTWPVNGRTYSTTGTYQEVKTNRFGCDSVLRLVLTMNTVDTIDTTATICPGEVLTWHTIRAGQSGHYENVETDAHGDMRYYRLDLTVRELQEEEIRFTICGDEAVTFLGKTYDRAGHYYDKGSCDTLYHIIVSQHPTEVYTTTVSLDGVNPYHWYYYQNGQAKDSLFAKAGTYEFTSPNATTGCNDIWRLILDEDKNSYHFIESVTLCEGEVFSWRGHNDLSLIPGDAVYTEHLYTRTGQDSIYELRVHVNPIEWSDSTILFCSSITWKGVDYSQSAIVYDTLTSATGCDAITRVSLRHVDPFFRRDTATIVQGEQLIWHGLTITTNGIYQDKQTNQYGCDSIYELHVGIEAAAPQENMITTLAEICQGDYYEWRGHKYYNHGHYPDTVIARTQDEKDTIYVLNLKVTQVETRHEQYSFCEGEKLENIYGKNYTSIVKTGEVYRDTVEVPNAAHVGCPDTVYLTIYKYPINRHTEVAVLHPHDTIIWHEQEITGPGIYTDEQEDAGQGGCKKIDQLRVIQDMRDSVTICRIDTAESVAITKRYPYVWREDTFYTSGLWTDTVFDEEELIKEFHSLALTITQPYDTTVYLHGCNGKGVVWQEYLYMEDTVFIDRIEVDPYDPKAPCDSVFHVHIIIDTVYSTVIDTVLREYQLPLIIGRQMPDTIWEEGTFRHPDTTMCGCDSIIEVNLHIIPKLTKNDSTFICEDEIKAHPVYLGDTINPWFSTMRGGLFDGTWQGKWHGVKYTEDTIVWDWNHEYFHHIIVRPSQKVPKDTTYYLCEGDSVQLFWPKTQWIKQDTVYFDTVPMGYDWTDATHGYTYHDQQYLCDSVTRWTVKFVHPEHKDTTAHRLLGDSIWWGGAWRYYTGVYDSIGAAKEKNSDSIPCQLVYSLHLIMDSAYYFRDTVDLCSPKYKTHSYIWPETGHKQDFTVGDKDTVARHYTDSLITYDRRDSIYDLCVNYRIIRDTLLFDTICEGTQYRFDSHRGTVERWVDLPGRYTDTLTALNGCDSIVTLQLYVRHRVEVTHETVHIPDTAAPYIWQHNWYAQGVAQDSAMTLYVTGEYAFVMPNRYGCDSIDSLHLFVHKTYRIQEDSLIICHDQTPYTWQDRNDITETGDFTFHTLTHDGYDSTRYVHIEVLPVLHTLLVDTLCYGDSLRFGLTKSHQPRFLHKTGIYYDTLTSAQHGCDSIIELRLNVYPLHHRHTQVDIADTQMPYEWKHIQGGEVKSTESLFAAGEYAYHFTTAFGCDSVDSLSLRVHQTYHITEDTIYICADATPYSWCDKDNIMTTGDYVYHGQTYDHYDSIRTVHIHVWPIERTTVYQTICEGTEFRFGTQLLAEQGTYYDTLVSVHQCDSIVTLVLQVQPQTVVVDHKTIFLGDSVEFHGTWYKESGIYEHKSQNGLGCEDIHQLVLTVLNEFHVDTTAVVCVNELPFLWRGYEFSETGDYSLPITWKDSARVIMTLHLTVRETFYVEKNVSICAGDTFLFKGKEYHQSGWFMDTIPSMVGCDSIVKYIVSMHPTYDRVFEKHISDKEPYQFHDRVLTQTGTYEWTGKTVHGCDSMEHLILTVHPSFFHSDTIHLCQSDSLYYPYKWRDVDGRLIATINQSGVYNDSVLTEYGFDSVHQLVVYVHPAYLINEQYEIGDGEVLKIHNKVISEPTVYMDTLRTVHGCDSVFHVVVNAKRTHEFTWTKTICQGDYFEWLDGRKLTTTGNYKYVSQYKDSIVYLNLTVLPTTYSEKRIVVTDKTTSYIYDGKLYDNLHVGENLFTENYVNQYGCDSIRRFIICVTTHYSEWYPIPLCPGKEFLIDGDTIREAGLYTYERRSRVTGEIDSLYRIEVYESPAFEFKPDTMTICQGDSVEYAGKIFKKPGFYPIKLKTIDGCDSIYYLNLIVNPVYFQEETVKVLDDEVPYYWEGDPYYMTGDYIRSWQVNECDDTHVLHLTVVEPQYIEQNVKICNSDSMFWRGQYYSAAGDYYDIVRDTINKIKTIYTLHLETVYPTDIISARTTDICADAQTFDIEFEYNGTKPTHYSVYFDALAKHEGFKDVIDAVFLPDMIAHVELPQYTEMAYNNHPVYVKPNKYTMRLVVDNSVCGVSSSNDIEIVVKYPNWIIEQHWDDVVAPLKKTYNGGFEFSEVDWYVNGALQPNNSLGYLHNDKLKEGDEVVMYATRKGENYSIPTCPLIIKAILPNTTDEPILVYPTQAPRQAPVITIEAPQGGHYAIYSYTGTLIGQGTLNEGKIQVELPRVSGMYFVRTTQGDEGHTHKVMVY